jgi:arylsulfatase A-like enzyme
MNDHIIYIATDRLAARRLKMYGGYSRYPNLDRIAEGGTLYENAIACAGSTIMCHSSEWLGKYPHQHKGHLSHRRQLYGARHCAGQPSIFSDMAEKGYDTHLIFLTKPNGYYETYKMAAPVWADSTYVHVYPDWHVDGAEPDFDRTKHMLKVVDALEQSEKRGKKAFVWIKMHGCYSVEKSAAYRNYADQYRPTKDCIFNAMIDDAVGTLMQEIGYPDGPEIWFASDHGSFKGERGKYFYGYDMYQPIIHVPLIRSTGGGKRIPNVFSMKEVRRLVTRTGAQLNERYIFAETLYPGQVPDGPNKGRRSIAKVMVREGRYKYIYNPFGPDGDLPDPVEELFDVEFDPAEQCNMVPIIEGEEYFDQVRKHHSGKRKRDLFTRYHPDMELKINHHKGWGYIEERLVELRGQARALWAKTGRGEYFRK